MVNLVLFGLGRAGRIHYNNIINDRNLNLKYVVEHNDISNLILSDVKWVKDSDLNIDNILKEKDIDAIIVASPTFTHYKLIKQGLKYNKHIFVEKPIVNDYEKIIECFDEAKNKNLVLFVGYNRRFDPTIMNIKERIDNNEIGLVNYALTISRDYPYPIVKHEEARSKAHAIATEMSAKVAEEAELKRSKLEAELIAESEKAEDRIASARQAALDSVWDVAAEVTKDITVKLTGLAADDKQISAALNKAAKGSADAW